MTAREVVERVLSWVQPEGDAAAGVYGTINVGLVLAAEDPHTETYPKLLVATVVAVLLYWLVHAYAATLGGRLTRRQGWSVAAFAREAGREWPIVEGAGPPIVTLAIAGLAGAPLVTAVTAATWCAAVTLLVLELLAALRAHLHGRQLVANVAIGVALGGSIVGLKALLH